MTILSPLTSIILCVIWTFSSINHCDCIVDSIKRRSQIVYFMTQFSGELFAYIRCTQPNCCTFQALYANGILPILGLLVVFARVPIDDDESALVIIPEGIRLLSDEESAVYRFHMSLQDLLPTKWWKIHFVVVVVWLLMSHYMLNYKTNVRIDCAVDSKSCRRNDMERDALITGNCVCLFSLYSMIIT